MRTLKLAIFSAMLASLAGAAERPPAAEQAAKAIIEAKDLNTRYEIRGPLGIRLGKVVTIKGKRVDRLMKAEPKDRRSNNCRKLVL